MRDTTDSCTAAPESAPQPAIIRPRRRPLQGSPVDNDDDEGGTDIDAVRTKKGASVSELAQSLRPVFLTALCWTPKHTPAKVLLTFNFIVVERQDTFSQIELLVKNKAVSKPILHKLLKWDEKALHRIVAWDVWREVLAQQVTVSDEVNTVTLTATDGLVATVNDQYWHVAELLALPPAERFDSTQMPRVRKFLDFCREHLELYASLESKPWNTGRFFTTSLDRPMVFPCGEHERLGLQLPPGRIDARFIAQHTSGMQGELSVIDVERQLDEKLLFCDLVAVLEQPPEERSRLLNSLSLEFSRHNLRHLFRVPDLVRQLDWSHIAWPQESAHCANNMIHSTKFSLLSCKGSFTDFHTDFGGTSVWYHIVTGEKLFVVLPPTQRNLSLYQNKESRGLGDASTFLGTQALNTGDPRDRPMVVRLLPGQTLLLPGAWPHAVYTLEDSVVFGGNFLHMYSLRPHMLSVLIEAETELAPRFCYPNHGRVHWYAAMDLCRRFRALRDATERVGCVYDDTLRENLDFDDTVPDYSYKTLENATLLLRMLTLHARRLAMHPCGHISQRECPINRSQCELRSVLLLELRRHLCRVATLLQCDDAKSDLEELDLVESMCPSDKNKDEYRGLVELLLALAETPQETQKQKKRERKSSHTECLCLSYCQELPLCEHRFAHDDSQQRRFDLCSLAGASYLLKSKKGKNTRATAAAQDDSYENERPGDTNHWTQSLTPLREFVN
ncbi:MAG: hypothetical protein MHM6MM_001921 [Cercozoa sp. M6MM]